MVKSFAGSKKKPRCGRVKYTHGLFHMTNDSHHLQDG